MSIKISIEGNRGVGKTYYLELLKREGFCVATTFEDCGGDTISPIVLYEGSPYTTKLVYGTTATAQWMPDIIIYLHCHPSICHQRKNTVGLEVLETLHLHYECTLNELNCSVPLYKINAQEDPSQIMINLRSILHQCHSFIMNAST